jgi:hypothetical protein
MVKKMYSITPKQAKFLKDQCNKYQVSEAEILRRILDKAIDEDIQIQNIPQQTQ